MIDSLMMDGERTHKLNSPEIYDFLLFIFFSLFEEICGKGYWPLSLSHLSRSLFVVAKSTHLVSLGFVLHQSSQL